MRCSPSPHAWLKGDSYERADKLAEHLRGNDVVMWEVEYRHHALWKAILAGNQDYALYQLEKIKLAMDHGKERRPKRAQSYDWFLSDAHPKMVDSITRSQDQIAAFQAFTSSCVVCHSMENVPFVPVIRYWELEK